MANRATLSINDVTMVEGDSGNTNFVFTIESDIVAQEDIAVTVNTSDLFDAVAGTDYSALTQTATIAKGTSSVNVTVIATTDTDVELDETFAVTLSNPLFNGSANASRVILGDETGIGTIVNDDDAVLSIDDVSVVEGDGGATNLVFTVTSTAEASRDVDFRINTATLADAVGGTDYVEIVAQTGVISAGALTTTVNVAVIGDTVVETDETVSVLLTSARFNGTADAGRVSLGKDSGVGTITDDDTTTISIDDVTMLEGDGGVTSFMFTLNSTAFTDQDIDVTVNTSDLVEAVAGTDYTGITNGVATIAGGTNTGILTVDVAADTTVELQETFSVKISDAKFDGALAPTKVTITDDTAIGTIVDDDIATISVADVSIAEGNTGTTTLQFVISSDADASRELAVSVNTADIGSAIAGTDYTAVSIQPATIAVGQQTATVDVTITGEQLVELDETFAINLSNVLFDGAANPAKAQLGDAQAIGTITNDDVAAISINDVSIVEGDTGTTDFVFTITSSLEASHDIDVTVDTSTVTEALAGVDFTGIAGQTATIAAGDQNVTLTVSALTDTRVELDEAFAVTLTDGKFAGTTDNARVTFADAVGIGTILNDDKTQISISDASVVEGDAGSTNLQFTISSSLETSKALEVTVNTADLLEAVAGNDYTAVSNQQVTIAADSQSTTLLVAVTPDALVEIDETIAVNLTDAKFDGGTDTNRVEIGTASGTGTIINDDVASLSIDDVTMTEVDTGGNTTYVFNVTSDAVASKNIVVAVNTADIAGGVGCTRQRGLHRYLYLWRNGDHRRGYELSHHLSHRRRRHRG